MEYLVKEMLLLAMMRGMPGYNSMWNEELKKVNKRQDTNIRESFGKHIYDGSEKVIPADMWMGTLEDVCSLVNPSIGVIPIPQG